MDAEGLICASGSATSSKAVAEALAFTVMVDSVVKDTLNSKVTATISFDGDGSFVGILALYDANGNMVAAKTGEPEGYPGETDIEIVIPNVANISSLTAKAMVWDSMETLVPMAVDVIK